jgi:predicted nucleic acid-binding protein
MYLLDTNVVSEIRKPKPHGAVLAWLRGLNDQQLFLSAFSLGEIQAGIEMTRDQDTEKASSLEAWLDQIARTYNVLPLDGVVLRTWARFMHRKSDTLYEDAMIAATAHVHGLTVATRNVTDFKSFGVAVFDPFRARN